jgi:hypothetical protein
MIKVIMLASYLLTAMNNWVPQSDLSFYEKASDTDTRYMNIALAIAEAALDPSNEPLFDGEDGRVKTALVLASTASWESGYNKRVMLCKKVGDNGQAFGLWQTHSGRKKTCGDIKAAAVIAMEMIRTSMTACKSLPLKYQMAAYTNGHCCRSSHSADRMGRGLKWFDHQFPDLVEINE